MPKPGARDLFGSGDAGWRRDLHPGLDRTSSMPNIGFESVDAAPPGPPPPHTEERKSPGKAKEPRRSGDGGPSTAAAARGPSTSSAAPARVVPSLSPGHPQAVVVRPSSFRPVPTEAPKPASAYPGRAQQQARITAPKLRVPPRAPAPAARPPAPTARKSVPPPRTSAPDRRPPAAYDRTPAPKAHTPSPPAHHSAQKQRPAASTASSGAASAAPAPKPTKTPSTGQVPCSPAPPRTSAYDSPAGLSACSSHSGSSMSIESAGSAGSADSRPGDPRARRDSPTSPTPLMGLRYDSRPEPRPQRRRRSTDEAEEEAKRHCLDPPRPQRDHTPPPGRDDGASPSYAEMARTPRASPAPPTTHGREETRRVSVSSLIDSPPKPAAPSPQNGKGEATAQPKPKPPKRTRYPPLVVEKLPGWATHFRALRDKLGHPPNARPYGEGVRFLPESGDEYRVVQSYLTGLEKRDGIAWFAYSPPAERSIKVAIRGLPADTTPEEITEELRALGHEPEYVRHIRARQGRPGCVFHAVLKRTQETRSLYDTTEFMLMKGVVIEAWRGKRGPAQCHRCQKFRHSSHHCHRPLACVRCGEGHTARDCPRPREEPATCANCGGDHPANNVKCPVFQTEIRNRRAGTVAATTASRRPQQVTERQKNVDANEVQGVSLMAPANGPTNRGEAPPPSSRRRKRRKKKRGRKGNKPAPPPAQEEAEKRADLAFVAQASDPSPREAAIEPAHAHLLNPAVGAGTAQPPAPPPMHGAAPGAARPAGAGSADKNFTACAIKLLMGLIRAIREGQDPGLTVLDGLAELTALYYGSAAESGSVGPPRP